MPPAKSAEVPWVAEGIVAPAMSCLCILCGPGIASYCFLKGRCLHRWAPCRCYGYKNSAIVALLHGSRRTSNRISPGVEQFQRSSGQLTSHLELITGGMVPMGRGIFIRMYTEYIQCMYMYIYTIWLPTLSKTCGPKQYLAKCRFLGRHFVYIF